MNSNNLATTMTILSLGGLAIVVTGTGIVGGEKDLITTSVGTLLACSGVVADKLGVIDL